MLFVYGTLRPGFDGPMAQWLRRVAQVVGPATADGVLYRIDDYPGFVPADVGKIRGDLFALPDPDPILACLDDYEECGAAYPLPHEYRRVKMRVSAPWGRVDAWVYVYNRPVEGLERMSTGDFLSCKRPRGV